MVVEESQVSTPACDGLDIQSMVSELCDSHSQMPVPEKSNIGRVLSTPTVRNLAKQYNININDVRGTGEDGRVLQEDVIGYAVHKGIVKESSASSSYASLEQFLGGDDGYSNTPAAVGLKYVDSKVPLRYCKT